MRIAVRFAAAAILTIATGCSGTSAFRPLAPPVSQMRAAARCNPTFYRPVGAPKPSPIPLEGPGIVIGGGGLDVDREFVWIHDTIVGSRTRRGGDLVVLRATGTNDYDRYIYGLARYHSVRTLKLPTCSSSAALRRAAAVVADSSAVFFAGGDQADYVLWKNTPLQSAVQGVYDAGGVIGGTSAGAAILGQFVFDARHDNRGDATSRNAVQRPYERLITFTYGFLKFPPLQNAITDMHFVTRNRFGRTAVFMARQIAAGKTQRARVLGIGVDEASGIVIDKHGIGTLLLQGFTGSAFLIRGGAARQLKPNEPFVSGKLTVTKLQRSGDTFDFATWCGREPTYEVRVDGRRVPQGIYVPRDPYAPPPGARIPKC